MNTSYLTEVHVIRPSGGARGRWGVSLRGPGGWACWNQANFCLQPQALRVLFIPMPGNCHVTSQGSSFDRDL